MAQRSRFCLRAAVVEFARGLVGQKLAIWLLAFSCAVIVTQTLSALHWVDTSTSRQLSSRGSLSGAAIGGLLFGVGMILARGCASRLLVLSANGNLRALLSGLIFAVTAQASLSGVLSPLRLQISEWWTIEATSRDLLAWSGIGHGGGVVFGLVWLGAGIYFGVRARIPRWGWIGGLGAGLAVACAWWFTFELSRSSFEPVGVKSLTFSGPSAEVLMRVLTRSTRGWDFDIAIVPGVFAGSFLAAWWGGDLKLEGFGDGYGMRRYIAGALLMGFGAMLAGGCAVGAGVSGASVFAVTAWVALGGMWIGAAIADRIVDQAGDGALGSHPAIPTPAGALPAP